jgi:Uma2 family endonuclease
MKVVFSILFVIFVLPLAVIAQREKLRVYQQIPTVEEYVIIEQDKIHLEIHRRQTDAHWIT